MQQASTYQRDPTDVVGNPSNQLQTNDVAHGETLLGFTEQANGRFDFPACDGQRDSILCQRDSGRLKDSSCRMSGHLLQDMDDPVEHKSRKAKHSDKKQQAN
jgi:hypothetical protein